MSFPLWPAPGFPRVARGSVVYGPTAGGIHGSTVNPYGNGDPSPLGLVTPITYHWSASGGTTARCAITLAPGPNANGAFRTHVPMKGLIVGIRTHSGKSEPGSSRRPIH